jgi:hypothetical protein
MDSAFRYEASNIGASQDQDFQNSRCDRKEEGSGESLSLRMNMMG